jgi:hypothetical protein
LELDMTDAFETAPVHLEVHQAPKDLVYYRELNAYYARSQGTDVDKLRTFTKHVPVAEIGRFVAKNEIFRQTLGVQGSVVECGVFRGGGLMTWATLSAIYEPLNHLRRIIGFDSFAGFVSLDKRDDTGGLNPHAIEGGLLADSLDDLKECARIFDIYRPLGHIPKIELVKGDALETIPEYLQQNGHLVVALLYLDFDLYQPTRCAIEQFLPRMPKGAIIAFDQLNQRHWPGETRALVDTIGIRSLRLQRLTYQPQICYAVLE